MGIMSVGESTGPFRFPFYLARTGSKAWRAMLTGKSVSKDQVQEPLPWTDEGYGWGGHEYFDTAPGCDNTPIIFVRGNRSSAADWTGHANYFLEQGYTGDELWAVEFPVASPDHQQMADRLDDFVRRVRDYTGSDSVNIVAHSLGVTGVRYWLTTRWRFEWVHNFVALAGANHGTSVNLFSWGTEGVADVIGMTSNGRPKEPLRRLNEFGETPGDVNYYTIRGAFDEYFVPNPESPKLEGAVNVELFCDHTGVRDSIDTLELLIEWFSES